VLCAISFFPPDFDAEGVWAGVGGPNHEFIGFAVRIKPVVNLESADRLKSLQKKLAKAIEAEDFEQAAVVRDEIKKVSAPAAESTKA
jgi:protein-arginine kinase activator protein McsA